jgi:glycosyltransferase involved in cell wall biosynthesis
LTKFTIITVVKNNVFEIEKTINSLKNQKFKNFEHIIVDANSRDGTSEIIQRKINSKNISSITIPDPKEIKGSGKVSEVIFTINEVEDGEIIATDKTFSIKAGLVVTAIGYNATKCHGIKIENGRIANIAGHVEHNVYVVGWAKRGPIGVIGTNKSDSADVVGLIIKNLK